MNKYEIGILVCKISLVIVIMFAIVGIDKNREDYKQCIDNGENIFYCCKEYHNMNYCLKNFKEEYNELYEKEVAQAVKDEVEDQDGE